ncbi:GDSL esterase/lipase CPRD49 [Cinnamomum micranthum f. kanehirae]|uniref:GDSL esterase/lipase CPRD49 n=1 Tax=Cinnamomum micranthum f. kanehirae TaxID=337451 RepID=A0A443P617_9MAGN|nr:GDSL esterase/lipase CPRD49 [Cinnamomum micranthum f. kanehirae]
MVGPRRPVFVLFGSSIVQFSFSSGGWGATLADIYARKADILLRGYSGWNSRRALQVVDQVFPKDAAVQPSLVIVYFGGNDSMGYHSSGLGPHVPLSEYIENMRKIASHLKVYFLIQNLPCCFHNMIQCLHPNLSKYINNQSLSEQTRIIFLSCPPINEEKVRQNSSAILCNLDRSNEACRRYSEACIELCKEMGLKVIDLWTAVQNRAEWETTCFTDGIHFSSVGSNIVVEEILKVLKEAEWEPSLHWKSLPTEFGEDSLGDLVASDGKTTINISEWTFHREIQWD